MVDGRTRAIVLAEQAVRRLGALGVAVDVDGEVLVDARARFTGARPTGRVSAGGSCHLLPAVDGWCAVNLPRDDDLELLPAWLGVASDDGAVPWERIADTVRDRSATAVVASGQELGLAVAALGGDEDEQLAFRGMTAPARPWLARRVGPRAATGALDGARVVDLSSLWAGPSCARLLGLGGARVVKVESTTRPDGSRRGDPGFHRWLHEGHELVEFDFSGPDGRRTLAEVVADADIVIEGSRPRASERLGLDPQRVVGLRPGVVWVSITAYGRCGPWRDRVGFGDDAAVAGGLVDRDGQGDPLFVADAVADPLTGAVAAALVAGAVASGGGIHIDVALREVARAAAVGATLVW